MLIDADWLRRASKSASNVSGMKLNQTNHIFKRKVRDSRASETISRVQSALGRCRILTFYSLESIFTLHSTFKP